MSYNDQKEFFNMHGKPSYEELEKKIQALEQNKSEHRKAKKKFQEIRNFSQTLLQTAPFFYVAVSAQGKILMANDTMLNALGYKQDEVVGKDCMTTFVPEKYHGELSVIFDRLIKSNKPTLNENYILTRDQKEVLVEWHGRSVFNEKGELNYFFGLGIDITERKRTEEELRKSEERYREYFEENISGTYISSPKGKLIACNREYERIFGFKTTQQALDTPIHNFFADSDGRDKFLTRLIKEKRITGYEPNLKKIDGTPIHLIENASGVFDDENNLKHIRGFLLDLTEQKRLESHLQQAQKMEAIGTLAGGIAHDFNNILFPVLGHTEILLQDVPEGSPEHDRLKKIYGGAIRARDLVKQILAFSRQDRSQRNAMKLQPIIKEVLKFIRSAIPTTIKIMQDIRPDCGSVKADPIQIHQIVMNLTTNAYHAMEKSGGELNVSLKEIEFCATEAIPSGMEPGVYACLTVEDTGIGMDKELAGKIFDPFFTTKEKGKGTGMGLAVVHGIVADMNGIILTDSKPGRGTQFNVYFHVEKSVLKEENFQAITSVPRGTGSILIVDDEEAIVTMQTEMLESLGYRVVPHTSSTEALETFRKTPGAFDLVITDMTMPDMPGDRLAAEMVGIRPDIPVLLCTGFSKIMSEEKAVSLGIKGFLIKPIQTKILAQKICQLLGKPEIKKS